MGEILSGDEAVARGVWEAGCTVAAAYPGTPSTEILENVAKYKKDIYSQWACNEKVAVEIVEPGFKRYDRNAQWFASLGQGRQCRCPGWIIIARDIEAA